MLLCATFALYLHYGTLPVHYFFRVCKTPFSPIHLRTSWGVHFVLLANPAPLFVTKSTQQRFVGGMSHERMKNVLRRKPLFASLKQSFLCFYCGRLHTINDEIIFILLL